MAGVEHDEIGVLAVGGGAHALLPPQFGHPIGGGHVHLATEALDFESLGSHSFPPIGEWGCEVKPSLSAMAWRAACASCLRSAMRSSGSRTCTVTGRVPRRPSNRRTLSLPGSSHQPISAAASL